MEKGLFLDNKMNQTGVLMSAEFVLTQEDILNLKTAKNKVFVKNNYWTVMPFMYDELAETQLLRLDLYRNT